MKRGGFTLPAVLVSSIVLMLLLIGATQISAATVRALREQYYTQLAREAAEAGAERIGECIRTGHFHPAATITPKTDCEGTDFSWGKQYLFEEGGIRTSFKGVYITSGGARLAQTIGQVELTRKSDGVVYATYTATSRQQVSQEIDPTGSRASKRWWHFGRGVELDFGTSGDGMPIVGTSPGAAASEFTYEGVTVVTDRLGERLFFSDGRTVWNKNGHVIENGSGIKGSETATQAVAAFPLNESNGTYVIVSASANEGTSISFGELYYSVIDTKYNGGAGRVLPGAKNIPLSTERKYAGEALSAVPNQDGTGYWVYTYKPSALDNRVIAFQMKENPSNAANPVTVSPLLTAFSISSTDPHRARTCNGSGGTMNDPNDKYTGFGSVTFDPEYKRVVIYMGSNGCAHDPIYARVGTLHLFHVNRQTGLLTRQASWFAGTSHSGITPTTNPSAYVADFSPSGRYVYAAQLYPGTLYRYDTHAGGSAEVKSSERFIAKTACSRNPASALGYSYPGVSRPDACMNMPPTVPADNGGGAIARGPDGRMYVADAYTWHASVIDRPDAPSSPLNDGSTASRVGWRYAGLRLKPGTRVHYGLPQMVTLYSPRLTQY